ncbi:septum formation family protein [Spirillospora sp. NPDC047418]
MTTPPVPGDGPDDSASAWAPPDASPLPEPSPRIEIEPPTAVRRPTNRFAVAALVTGLVGMVLFAVGFAVAAFVQTGRRGEKGRGLAIGGLAASLAWVTAIALLVTVGPLSPAGSDSAGRADGRVAVTAMRPGDCFSEFVETPDGMFVKPLPCTTPHQGEFSAATELSDIPYPGRREASDRAWTACRERTEFLERSRYGKDLELRVAPPDEDAWKDGDRTARCLMRYTGSGLLPSALDQTIETKAQDTSQLSPGDCIKKWDDYGNQPLIACTKEHEYEVLGFYTLRGGEYPGDEKLEKKAFDGCDELARKAWGEDRPPGIDIAFAGPDRSRWEHDMRLVICLVTGLDGPLKRSVVPH